MMRSKSKASLPPPEISYRKGLTLRDCIYFTVVLIAVLIASDSEARPSYALKSGINRCTACHYSPAGGGPRNLTGKYYGSGGFKLTPWSAQPYAGADIKYIYYRPDKHSATRNGLAVMAGSVWAAIPLLDDAERSYEARVVGEHNIGGFSTAGPRNLYLRYALRDEQKTSWLPQQVLFGRFIPPFGLMTDEHRTYVRMQTGSTWNTGVRMGLLLASNPFEALHYDIAAMNFNSATADGSNFQQGESTQWAYLLNLRFMPASWGVFFGHSAAYYEGDIGKDPRHAQSVYAGLSIDRWTGSKVPITLLLEYAQAKNWNSAVRNFFSDTAYETAVATTHSRGILARLDYDITQKVQLNYQYDTFIPDRDYSADVYQRHGFGFKHFFGPNMWFQMRYENAASGRPNEEAGTGIGGLNAFWTVVSLGI